MSSRQLRNAGLTAFMAGSTFFLCSLSLEVNAEQQEYDDPYYQQTEKVSDPESMPASEDDLEWEQDEDEMEYEELDESSEYEDDSDQEY